MTALRIDVWSDIVCPWCYVGKRRLEAALAKFPHETELVYHSFELDPRAPRVRDESHADHLAAKYRLSREKAQQLIDQMTRTGAAEGIAFHYDRARAGNTFDAHRLLHLARAHGKQLELKERLMRAYFTDGVAIGDADELAPIAIELGLPAAEVRDVLASDRYSVDVRRDEQLAAELGITGVPFFVMAGRFGVSGAQTPDVLLGALERAYADVAADESGEGVTDADACGPDGC